MKTSIPILILCLVSASCGFNEAENPEGWPPYTAKIAWDSGLYSNSYHSHMVDGDYVYFYERPPGYTFVNIYTLTKLDARTGKFIWRTAMFSDIILCQPVAIGDYIYVFLMENVIVCFDKNTGEQTATVEVKVNNDDFARMNYNIMAYEQYLYLSIWDHTGRYFTRLDMNNIDYGDANSIQSHTPEIIWELNKGGFHLAKPVVHNNTVYTATWTAWAEGPVQLAGFDLDTMQMVFYETFGGLGVGDIQDLGSHGNPIFIYKDTLYYLSKSISAWNLNTGELLFRHIFTRSANNESYYFAIDILQAAYYQKKIYYTSKSHGDMGFRNIHCIDAKTGELVWNTAVKNSYTLDTNLIIHNDRLYVAQSEGFFVYDPKGGGILGVDRFFRGEEMSRNILYNDYIICIRMDNGWEGKLVAVYVGK